MRVVSPSRRGGCICWWLTCFVVLCAIILGRANANYCEAPDDDDDENVRVVRPSERLIALNRHDRIAYVDGTKSLEANQDFKLRYFRSLDFGVEEFHEFEDTPQYFMELRDKHVEKEVEYRAKNDRWSDRVILERLYFGLNFGRSGYPLHYYDGYDDDEMQIPKLDKEEGWDIYARDSNICEWKGVTCYRNKVIELRLDNYEFKGTLPEAIQYLTDLEYLDLKGNAVGGTLPTTLAKLTKLKYLCMAVNKFEGTLPKRTLAKLTSLEKLWLSGNLFTGTLPRTGLSTLSNLLILDLSNNKLVGTIPESFALDFPNLTNLFLELNAFTGRLPEDVRGLQSLRVLDVGDNLLTGSIPSSWMSIPTLKEFNLSVNRLTGTLPSEILELSDLSIAMMASNRLTGTLPSGDDPSGDPTKNRWYNLSKLTIFIVSANKFTGTIPAAFYEASASTLANLDVAYNSFTGTFPSTLGKLTNLKRLGAQVNKFRGTLPMMNRLNPILDLNLTGNLLEGTVPNVFCGSGAMSRSILFRQFGCDAILCPAGTFHPNGAATMESACRPCPASDEDEEHDPPLNRILGRMECPGVEFVHGDLDGDGQLSEMEILRLLWTYTLGHNWGAQFQKWGDPHSDHCDLNGITCVDGTVAKIDLSDASMCSNGERKQGPVKDCHGLPAELNLLTDLEILIANRRQFLHGTLPSELSRLSRLKYLDLGANPNMVGTIPSEFGLLSNMKIFNIAGSRFTGTIPEEFWEMTNMEKLHLSMNPFTGTLSTKVGRLTNLKELMWSRSQLSGQIPEEIGDITALENLELYGNQLTGTIPSSIGNCSNLKRIDLFNNDLVGPLPESLTKLSSLQILHVKLNQLTGTIPSGFGDLPFLSWFDVSSNALHGTIPESFASSRTIKDFRLGGNMIYDPIPPALCTNTNINGGLTRTYGCDGVICPLGTYSDPGHATHSEGCKPCPEGMNTLYLGSSSCDRVSDGDILAIFFNVMGGASWNEIQINHWRDPEGNDLCEWNGVTCDENGLVSSIRFPLAGLDDPDLA